MGDIFSLVDANDIEYVEKYLIRGNDPSAVHKITKESLLTIAVKNGYVKLAKLLINYKADTSCLTPTEKEFYGIKETDKEA